MSIEWREARDQTHLGNCSFLNESPTPNLVSHVYTDLSVGFGSCLFLVNLPMMNGLKLFCSCSGRCPALPQRLFLSLLQAPSEQWYKNFWSCNLFPHKGIIGWTSIPGEFCLSFRSRHWPDGTGLSAWICKAVSGGSVLSHPTPLAGKWPAQNLCHSVESLLMSEGHQHNAK